MYPMNMHKLPMGSGYAVANSDAERDALVSMGYVSADGTTVPPTVPPVETIESVRAQLDAAGVEYDKRLGLAKLKELL